MAGQRSTNPLFVFALVGLIGGGAYNYHRNFQAEAAVPRPYASYSAEDLNTLLQAYQGEAQALEDRYQGARRALGRDSRAGMLDENVRAFEQAQRRGSQSRALGAQVSMRQSATQEIEAELARRQDQADALRVHLKRLLTI